MSGIEYSKRLGVLTDAPLAAALTRFDLGMLVRAEPIPFGISGQNLFVTSTRGDWVLRGCPYYDWQFPTEKFFADLLHDNSSVPVPFPFLFEASPDILGWSFILMPRMAGLQLADESYARNLAFNDRRGIARALARMLVEAQTLTWSESGKYDLETGTIVPVPQNYRVCLTAEVRKLILRAQQMNTNTLASDVAWVESLLGDTQFALATPFQPCIVFGDYKEPNTVVERTANGWRVSGVFDLMTTHFGDGEADLARPVGCYLRENPELAEVFVQEYLVYKTVAPGFAQRQQFYMLYDSAIIWTVWQQAGGLPEDKTLTFEKWAGPFVNFWEKFK